METVTGRRRRPHHNSPNRALWLFGLLAVCSPFSLPQTSSEPTEYQVKAAFLMNFTKFVEWPASAFPDAASPLNICILGDDPFGSALDRAVEGESAAGHKLAVQRLHRLPAARACQVLFVPKSEKDAAAVVNAAGPGVLTVGDREDFLRDGGIIAFVVQARHVRFDINLNAAGRASLGISARLLRVARTVQR